MQTNYNITSPTNISGEHNPKALGQIKKNVSTLVLLCLLSMITLLVIGCGADAVYDSVRLKGKIVGGQKVYIYFFNEQVENRFLFEKGDTVDIYLSESRNVYVFTRNNNNLTKKAVIQ